MSNFWFVKEYTVQVIIEKDQYNKVVATEEVVIKAKKEQKIIYTPGMQVDQMTTETRYFMKPHPKIKRGDIIEGKPIRKIMEVQDYNHKVDHWEVFA